MRDITRLLAEHGVNLESLSTEVRPAPMSSEPLFHADALLAVPLTLSLDTLRERLEDLADDLMVELVLDASEVVQESRGRACGKALGETLKPRRREAWRS